ncbi:hypothetical protein HHI36_021231 [Cryptolaemus montrouzieri]|uniref:PNT domain-containing protein n=1 Tax=Cryptolaemus montrouzieri TaxID=559131 RepID=A0ABD2MW57_9CUCU
MSECLKGWRVMEEDSLSLHNYITFEIYSKKQPVVETCDVAMPKRKTYGTKNKVYWWNEKIAELRRNATRARREITRASRKVFCSENDEEKLVRYRLHNSTGKIGFYCGKTKLKMALRTSQRVPVRFESNDWYTYRLEEDITSEHSLPKDPRQWTRDDVATWVKLLTVQHGLPEVSPSRFLMNGKALCLMTPSMFLDRVPLGGKLFYKDFQLRLCTTLYSPK